MAGLISWLGKEVKNAEHAIGGAVHGAENYVGHAAQQVPQAAQNVARQVPQVVNRVAPPTFNLSNFLAQQASGMPQALMNPVQGLARYGAPMAASALDFAGNKTAQGINKLDHNYKLPVVGNVGNAVGGLINSPAVTLRHVGQLAQGQNPLQGMSLPQAAGAVGVDALNAATLGKGGPLAKVAEKVAEKAVAGVGSQVAKKALANTIKTTLTAAPITTGYGAAGTLASGDTNLKDIATNAALGLATAPAMGLAHGALPVAGAGVKAGSRGLANTNAALGEGGYLRLPGAVGEQKGGPVVSYKDGARGVEISDKKMAVKPQGVNALVQGQEVPIQNLIDHKAQAKDYPTLFGEQGGVKAVLNNQIPEAFHYDAATRTMHLNPDVLGNTPERVASSLNGEPGKRLILQGMSKAVDDYAGIPATNPTDVFHQNQGATQHELSQIVKNAPDNVRARNIADRRNMSPRELKKNPVGQPPAPKTIDRLKQVLNERGAVPIDPSQHPNLHLDEATPAANANLDDVKSVGSAFFKTKAYIKRVEAAYKANPSDKLAQHLEALKNDHAALQERYNELRPKGSAATVDPAKVAAFKKSLVTPKPSAPTGLEAAADRRLASNITKQGVKLIKDDTGKKTAESTMSKIERQRSAEENTAANPVKVSIPKAPSGDYGRARVNTQLAANPVENAGRQFLSAFDRLSKSEKANSRYMIEDPSLAKSAAAKEFLKRFRYFDDRGHATSQDMGGNTFYKQNHFHRVWDLSDPEKAAKYAELGKAQGQDVAAEDFKGLNHQAEVFKSIKEGEALGFKLKYANPREDFIHQIESTSSQLRRQALIKGFEEADAGNPDKNRSFDLGNGKVIPLSEQGIHEIRAFEKNPQVGKPLSWYRSLSRGFKRTLLSISQFHPININILKAMPTLIGTPKDLITTSAHPILAGRGALNTFLSMNKGYSDKLMQGALDDGTIDAAARIGTPIRSGSDFSTSGKLDIEAAGGEKMIFDRQVPAMHIEMVRAVVSDLKKKGISLDSAEARAVGNRVHEIMGFTNMEARNLDKRVQRGFGDVALAPQFTRSKWATLKGVKDGGVAGNYARRAVIGNYTAEVLLSTAIGAAIAQKSDDIKDIILRSLVHPSIPTPFLDEKGNNIELGLPQNYASEALGLGLNVKRGDDGHLHLNFSPGKVPGNLANYGRSRLAVLPADALKVATNTNYAGKPLYDPNADAKTKILQGATTLGMGSLPIGGQGATQLDFIKKRLPQASQDILNAQGGGINPLLKSGLSAVGLTARTDKTVGKGLDSTRYFDAMDSAKQGLNSQEKAALTLYAGSKKNPVTSKYDVQPSAEDTSTKAKALLQNPKVIDNLIAANQKLASQGGKVDPLWLQSKDNIVKYFQGQQMAPGSSDKSFWEANNQDWYKPLSDQRSTFFDSLPPADPNKPNAPIPYPKATAEVQTLMDSYFNADSKTKSQMIKTHPELSDRFNQLDDYTNKMRVAQGYAPLKTYPKSTPYIEAQLNAKNFKDPRVQQYLNQVSAYNIAKGSGQAQFVGGNFSQSALKGVKNLGSYGVVQNTDGTLAIAGSNADAPGSQLARYASSGKKGRKGRATKMAKLPKFKPLAATKLPKFKAPKYTAHASKLPKIAKAKLPVTRKLA